MQTSMVLIKNTSFAVSSEESRPILNGVLWELRDGHMRMVATNGHRLARKGVAAGSSSAPSADFIVPPIALQQVQRLFESEEDLEVAKSGNHLGFRADGTEVYTRLIEGTYPNYEQVIPKDNDKFAIVDRDAFASAVRRMAVVASDQTHRIRMAFESDCVHLTVLTPDLGEGEDELELTYEGEGIEIGFNAAYLLEVLKYMATEEVKITLKAPERSRNDGAGPGRRRRGGGLPLPGDAAPLTRLSPQTDRPQLQLLLPSPPRGAPGP